MADRTPDATPTLDLGPGADDRRVEVPSAFDPPRARFDTVGELGRGGMGRVDDAFDRALGRPVAIKHMLSSSEVDLARFEREARITARLEHPGIVPIHDAGRGPDGTPYYVMRRVDGQPLDALVNLELADRLALIPNVLAACDAVAFAHARGIVHRDIKPTNLLVGPFGETLVIDWGLAREIGEVEPGSTVIPRSDPQLTRAGTVAGTPGFMAPEQARGEAVDARADVFALGATLFYVLSGELPYGSASATEMVDLAGAGRTPNWKVLPDDVPADLRAIAIKAMASVAAERYADAGALAADIRRFITGNLVGAYEYGWSSRLVRFMRRHRAAVAVSIVSALVLIAGATLSLRRIVSERDDARAARDDATAARELAETRQHDATAMADRLLVTHARELADSDPVAAIMALRRLAPDSTRWPEAWVAATAAWAHGISSGFQLDAPPTMIEANSSGKAFALIGSAGRLVVIDLAAKTQRTVATVGWGNQAHWIGPNTIAMLRAGKVDLVDTTTGAIRATGIAASVIVGDHDAKALVRTDDRRVIELTDAGSRELLTGVDELDAPPDLSKAVVRRGRRLELWTPTATMFITELPTPTSRWRVSIAAHGVAIFDEQEFRIWEIVDTHLVERIHVQQRFVAVVPVGDKWFADDATTASIALLDANGRAAGASLPDIANYFQTRGGLIALSSKGALHVCDEDGWFTLGPSPLQFYRADTSPDGRFVIASASNGDFVIWDRAIVKPSHISLTPGEQVTDLTDRFLWTNVADQLFRYDLATKAREMVLPFEGWAATGFIVDPGERFAWAFEPNGKRLRVYEAKGNRVFQLDGIAFATSSAAGLTIANDDGGVFRWQPGDLRPLPIWSFHKPLKNLATQDHYVLAIAEPHTLMRLDLDHGSVDTAELDATQLAIAPSGRTWISSGPKLWRWDRGQRPTQAEVPDHTDDVFMSGERLILHGHHSITEIRDGAPHSISVEVKQLSWRDDTATFAAVSAQNAVSVIERTSGLGVTLGTIVSTGTVVARGHRVAYIDRFIHDSEGGRPTVAVWTITVPEDPGALRHWLTTITNARSVADTDAHAWP